MIIEVRKFNRIGNHFVKKIFDEQISRQLMSIESHEQQIDVLKVENATQLL